ncbi:hypothetical protein BV372_30180 [Nostoc sp. T09]|nr:hypothetical protein BV372_30180 [Nostoc sp. T09]
MKVFEKGGFSLFFYAIHSNYLGNYQKEMTKFAPHLKTMLHQVAIACEILLILKPPISSTML